MTDTHEHGFVPADIAAPHLETQTLGGDKDYFHTENAPTHRTDGTAEGQSPETVLVAASRSDTAASEEFDDMNKAELQDLAAERGVEIEPRANKAAIIAALRG